ncbi:hypothetical protein P7C73_g3700, partial [Tremellales sp. Uapishka_1]
MTTTPAVPSSSTRPHEMRIAPSGSMQNYIKFALNFLSENPKRPLVLHTMPPSESSKGPTASIALAPPTTPTSLPTSTSTLHPSTLSTPRLISIVEIIKRDYMTDLSLLENGKGKNRADGLWQYTESGLLSPSSVRPEQDGRTDLERVLSGKTKPKMTHQPYLKITLSTRPLGLEKQRNVTCQYVMIRRRRPKASKAAPGETGEETESAKGLKENGSRKKRKSSGDLEPGNKKRKTVSAHAT